MSVWNLPSLVARYQRCGSFACRCNLHASRPHKGTWCVAASSAVPGARFRVCSIMLAHCPVLLVVVFAISTGRKASWHRPDLPNTLNTCTYNRHPDPPISNTVHPRTARRTFLLCLKGYAHSPCSAPPPAVCMCLHPTASSVHGWLR
jgi:hypothetical protein